MFNFQARVVQEFQTCFTSKPSIMGNAEVLIGTSEVYTPPSFTSTSTTACSAQLNMANTTSIPIVGAASSTARNTAWTPYLALGFLLYSLLCWTLRYQRRDAMHKKFNFPGRKSFAQMTTVEAQAITVYMSQLEFPFAYYTSIQFALFKTYGIPTISKLLVATKEFSSPENASKRYADTSILIQEFAGRHPTSPRALQAIARMNYIHSGYQKSGKISQEDLLYTLSVFITEPIRWVNQYEWRDMTEMEKCAVGTFWKGIGDAMGIEYEGRLERKEWRDGLEFYGDIKSWAEKYEEKYMVPAETNKKTADELVPLLLFYVPKVVKGWAATLVGVLMGNRLREAMSYPTPPTTSFLTVSTAMSLRRFILKHLSLPRPSFLAVREINDSPDPKTGRYHPRRYLAHPYYQQPTLWSRWGPDGWIQWLAGGDLPGDKGDLYVPEGYVFEEVGPKGMKNRGGKEVSEWVEKLGRERTAGCPFAFGG